MRPGPLQTAAQYLGGLITAAFFVVLLTFIFSFLGTIFCAALAGMMLGALRKLKWHSILVSLMFPAVIFTLLRGMKTDLAGRQIVLVAVICFAVFWLSYVVAATLFFFERSRPASTRGRSTGQPAPTVSTEAFPFPETATTQMAGISDQNGSLTLELLQGNWSGEATAEAKYQRKLMKIQKERLELSVADPAGTMRVFAKAQVKLCTLDSLQTLLLAGNDGESSADTLVSI